MIISIISLAVQGWETIAFVPIIADILAKAVILHKPLTGKTRAIAFGLTTVSVIAFIAAYFLEVFHITFIILMIVFSLFTMIILANEHMFIAKLFLPFVRSNTEMFLV